LWVNNNILAIYEENCSEKKIELFFQKNISTFVKSINWREKKNKEFDDMSK